MITIKTYGYTKHRFTGRELEINDLTRMYEYRIERLKERYSKERSELIAIMSEMEKMIEELESELENAI